MKITNVQKDPPRPLQA